MVVEVGTIAYASGSPTFTAIWSTATGGDCTSTTVPTAVRVSANDYTKYAFGPAIGQQGRTSLRTGAAGRKIGPLSTTPTTLPPSGPPGAPVSGGFSIGSSVASLNSNSSPILSSVLNGMVCRGVAGCSFSTTLVGYQGLATAGVTLGQLQAQLGAGSVSSLLTTGLKARDLYLASAMALGCSTAFGCSSAAAVTLLGLSTSVTSTATFKLADMITVASGSEAVAAATTFNVLGLVTGSAEVINGTNFVSVPVTTVTIPGGLGNPTSTTLKVKVIEGPQTYIGPVGGGVSTSQVQVTVDQELNLLNLPIVGIPLVGVASVTGTLPISVTAGSATGTLTQVNCVPTQGESVSVDTTGATTSIGDPVNKFLDVKVLGLKVAGLNVNASSSVGGVTGDVQAFAFPSQYAPATSTPRHLGGTTLNVQGTTVNSSLDVLGLTLNASALTAALTGVGGLVSTIDTAVISPVLRALGIDIGGADLWTATPPGCPAGPSVIGG